MSPGFLWLVPRADGHQAADLLSRCHGHRLEPVPGHILQQALPLLTRDRGDLQVGLQENVFYLRLASASFRKWLRL